MTTIWIDSRKRAAGRDEDFEFDIGETVHLQGSARLGVFKIRVADTFLSTDRGAYLYWKDTALGTLNWAQLPTGGSAATSRARRMWSPLTRSPWRTTATASS